MARIKNVPRISPKPSPPSSLSDSSPTSDFKKLESRWEASARRKDRLYDRPKKNHQYVKDNGDHVVPDGRFALVSQRTWKNNKKLHPKVAAAVKNGTITSRLEQYYEHFEQGCHQGKLTWQQTPLAGLGRNEPDTVVVPKVQASRVQTRSLAAAPARAPAQHEDSFHARPSIKLNVPDNLKAYLVDDWENVTKNQQIVPLPHPHPVVEVLEKYLEYERPHRIPQSSSYDILEETIAGLREYFDKSLGRILLYRFERQQYVEMYKKWQSAGPEDKHNCPADTYGPEHLCRLLVSLPELVAQTNMDQQSVNRLREELLKFCNWLSKHGMAYFVNEYDTPDAEYIEKARGT